MRCAPGCVYPPNHNGCCGLRGGASLGLGPDFAAPSPAAALNAEVETIRAAMRLPSGKTCGDCAHAKRCLAFGFTEIGNTKCDFHPSRYYPKEAAP